MAASFYSNSVHVDFESALAIGEPGSPSRALREWDSDQQAETKDAGDRPAAEEETPADRPAEEIVSVEQRVDESAVEVSGVDVVDPETVVQQVLNQLDFSTEGQDVAKGDRVETWFDQALAEEFSTAGDDSPTEKVNDEKILWFVRPFLSADHDNERLFETESDSADTMDFEVHSQTLPVVRDTNVDPAVIDMLWERHLDVLEELSKQKLAHGLLWDRTCCSAIFEGSPRDRGAVIARTNTKTPSKCWIRTMIYVNGLWTVEPCADRWVKIPQQVISSEVHRQRQYDDTLPPVNIFYKTFTKRWADICLEVVDFCASRSLLPVGSLQFCDLFSSVNMEDIRNFVGSIALERTILRNVQSSVLAVPSAQFPSAPHQSSPIFPDDTSMHFDETYIATPVPAFSLPVSSTVSADITRALNQLQASLDKISNRDDGAVLKDTILMHLRDIEKKFTARFDAQDRWIGALRNDSNDQRHLLSLEINSSHRKLHTQIAAATIDQIDMQREVKELIAKVDAIAMNLERVKRDDEATKEAILHQLFEFQSQAQANQNILHAQLSELVDYIHRGDADKNGESGSRGPQQPLNVQIRDSAVRPPTFAQRVDMAQRRIVETVLDADSNRESLERQAAAERDRERRRREARMLKRRRRF
ncbi:hypothetical protein F511_37269 [Dorcoceras hygrometricum]|uniref:Uncharacterized protein n=1 Tax=Dorcoceras hygrometricum TaxID=472368 RepID=A0A2Z7BBH0_9LAMI|nr:hypothetical protein F511_37269 [Dorcoceras hygrometricum]